RLVRSSSRQQCCDIVRCRRYCLSYADWDQPSRGVNLPANNKLGSRSVRGIPVSGFCCDQGRAEWASGLVIRECDPSRQRWECELAAYERLVSYSTNQDFPPTEPWNGTLPRCYLGKDRCYIRIL
ncbi:hypothetical protein KXW36_008937, partial [Aspergillus fumigatus]